MANSNSSVTNDYRVEKDSLGEMENVNEVLANRANEILTGSKGYTSVHPNDHVNLGQSTNDVIPAAMKIACYLNLRNLQKKVVNLHDSLSLKAKEFAGIVKLGRTCLQDAVPIMLGQQFSGYSALFHRCDSQINTLSPQLLELPLGATAVGTALNTADGYIDAVYSELKNILQEDVCKEENFFDGITVNETVCLSNAENSVALSAVIASMFDHETGTKVAKKAFTENKTIKQVVIEMDLLSSADAEQYLDPVIMTDPQKYRELFNK